MIYKKYCTVSFRDASRANGSFSIGNAFEFSIGPDILVMVNRGFKEARRQLWAL